MDEEDPQDIREVCHKSEFDNIPMKEIGQRSIIPEESPCVTPPLVNHLNFYGMANYGDNILLGSAK